MSWSTVDEMDQSVCGKELEDGSATVGKLYGVESSVTIMGKIHLLRSNSGVKRLSVGSFYGCTSNFYVNPLYGEARGEIDTGSVPSGI